MTARLPIPGGDDGTWGTILNSYLEVSHNADGTLANNTVGTNQLQDSSVTTTKLSATGTASSSTYLRGDGSWVTPNSGSSSLASDSDTSITSPTNNQVLTYNNSDGKWQNQNPAVSSVAGKTGTITLAESDIANLTTDLAATEKTANKGQASGYAPLNSSSQVPIANIPTGTTSSTVAIGNDSRFAGSAAGTANASLAATDPSTTNSRTPTGTASGDLTGTFPSPTVAKLNGTPISNTTPTDGQLLTYSGSSSQWEAQTGAYAPHQGVALVDAKGGDWTGIADSTAAFNAAVASLPVDPVTGYNIGTVVFGAGIYRINGPTNPFGPGLTVQGQGRNATYIYFYGTGTGLAAGQSADCFRVQSTWVPNSGNAVITQNAYEGCGGRVLDLTIDGSNAGQYACGIHYGDIYNPRFDCVVRHFNQFGSIGVWEDSSLFSTEKVELNAFIFDCTDHFVVSCSLGVSTTSPAGAANGATTVTVVAPANGFPRPVGSGSPAITVLVPSTGDVIQYTGYTDNGNGTYTLTGVTWAHGSSSIGAGATLTFSNVDGSHAYSSYRLKVGAASNQNCISFTTGASAYHGELVVRGNMSGSAVSVASVTTTSGQNTVTVVSGGFPGVNLRNSIQGAGIPVGATVVSIVGNTLTMSANASASATVTLGFAGTFLSTGNGGVPTGSRTNQAGTGPNTTKGEFKEGHLDIAVEYNITSTYPPQTMSIGTGASIQQWYGMVHFTGAAAWAQSNVSLNSIFALGQGLGIITGDTTLNPDTTGNPKIAGNLVYTNVPTGGSSAALYLGDGDFAKLTLTASASGAITFNGTIPTGPQRKVVVISQASNGGVYNRTVTWPTSGSPTTSTPNVIWMSGTQPTMSIGLGATDVYELVTFDGATWYGTVLSQSAPIALPVDIGTSTGPPTSGTYVAGQVWVDSAGIVWTCTAGGTPGTWGMNMGRSLHDYVYKATGALEETFPRVQVRTDALTITSQTLYLFAIPLIAGETVGHITFVAGATSGVGMANWWFSLFDNSRNLLALTADQTTATWTSGQSKTLAIATIASGASATYTPTYTGLGYVGMLVNAGTPPNLASYSVGATIGGIAPILNGSSNTAQTTPPAFPFQASALTAVGGMAYAYTGT